WDVYFNTLGGPEPTRLLLNDAELQDLADCFTCGPPELDRRWKPDQQLYKRYFNTVKDVRDGLSPQVAEDWSRDCVAFAKRLRAPRPTLPEGIDIVREWVCRLRKLLRAMGATALLPRPEGQAPTPTDAA